MQIVAHTLDQSRYIVARSDSPKADAVAVVGGKVSPVVPAGSLAAMADDWLPGAGDAPEEVVRKVLAAASKSLG